MMDRDLPIYKKLIKMKEITKPNYETWFNKDCWHGIEAACLFNGIDPSQYAQIKERIKKIYLKLFAINMNDPDAESTYAGFTFDEARSLSLFMKNISIEAEKIDAWDVPKIPIVLVNEYIQVIGNIPQEIFKLAAKDFSYLYIRRNDNDEIKKYWDSCWHHNIAAPFLQLTHKNILTKTTSKQHKAAKVSNDESIAKQKKKIKILLEESAQARQERIRNRGYEVYKEFREKHPHRKITKETVAKQVMEEERPLYKLLSKTNPFKKQPALGTYLKELRKMH